MRTLYAHKKPISSLAVSPDGKRLAEAAHGGTVRVWDVAAARVVQSFTLTGIFANQVRLAFSPMDGNLAAVDGDLTVFDLTTGKFRLFKAGGSNSFYATAFSPDGKELVAVGEKNGRWAAATGKPKPPLRLPVPTGAKPNFCSTAAYSPDGRLLAVARQTSRVVGDFWRNTNAVLLLGAAEGNVAASFEWEGHPARRLAFAPDGRFLAATCGPVLRVWDLGSMTEVAALKVGKLHFLGCAASPDGRFVATVSKDHTARLWDTTSWAVSRTFDWQIGKLLDVAFLPDGLTAAVAGDKGTILLFDVD